MSSPIPFRRFMASILRVYSGPGHARRTLTKMRCVLNLVEAIGVRTTADLTTETIAAFVVQRSETVNANTIRGDLSYLSAACSFAVEEGWLDRAPRFKRVRPRAVRSKMQKCHSIEEVARVLEYLGAGIGNWVSHRLYALVATVAYTGLRRDEALTLMVIDVSLVWGVLNISDRQRRKTMRVRASSRRRPV